MKTTRSVLSKITSIEIWIVSASVMLTIIYPQALPGTVIIGALFWLLRKLTSGRFTVRTPIDIGVLVLLLMVPINLWATAIPAKTYPQILRLLTGILLLYATCNWARTSQRIRWGVAALILATLFLALFAMISVEWTQQKLLFIPEAIYEGFILLVKDTVHRNIMAGFLVILYPITLGLLFFAWKEMRGWNRLLLLVVALIVFAILMLTQSRGAILAFGAVLMILVMLRWRFGWLILPICMVALGGVLYLWGPTRLLEVISSGVSLEGMEGRLEVWSRALFMIQDFPITGTGMGLFTDVADSLYPFFLNAPGSVTHAHNLFLQIAVDVGIPGLIAWLAIAGTILVISWQLHRNGRLRGDPWTAGLGAGLFGSQMALALHGLLDAATWGAVRPAALVWAIWGLTCAAWIYDRKKQARHVTAH